MGESDAERRIYIKGLSFFLVLGRTGSRITDMPDTAASRKCAHVARTENIPDQTVRLEHGELAVIACCDTGCILPAMLEQL